MQRAHDDFERGFFRKFWMRIDRNTAAVIGHGQKSVGAQFHFDEARMPRQRLVHRIVDDFVEQVVHRLLYGAADINAGPSSSRLRPSEPSRFCAASPPSTPFAPASRLCPS